MYVTRQMFFAMGTPSYDTGDFASLVGTVTPYTGDGSETSVQSGKYLDTKTNPDGSQVIFKFNGTKTQQSATFEGTLETMGGATYNLSLQTPNSSDYMFIQVGIETVTDIPAP